MKATEARNHLQLFPILKARGKSYRSIAALLLTATLLSPLGNVHAQTNPLITNFLNQALSSTLGWNGGTGIFVLQKKYDLSDPSWINVLTTSNRSFTVPREAQSTLYRLQSQATNTVLAFTAFLTGSSEVPATTSTGTGIAAFALEGSNLTYYVSFSGLTGPASAGHIHAPSTPLGSASVAIGFTVPAASAGIISGKVLMSQDQITNFVNGLCYVNIHTGSNPGGEIRGQVVPLRMIVPIDAASEVPTNTSSGTARATLTFIGDHLFYEIPYTNLSSPGIAAHIHGPSTPSGTAGVLVGLATPSGTSGTLSGSVILTPQQLAYVISGQTYINIHTMANSGGEIRGQIWPIQLGVFMDGPDEVPAVVTPATGSGVMNIISNKLSYAFSFTNLSATAIAAHIHGPASPTTTAGVMIGFSPPATTSGSFSGTATLSSQQLFYLINGMTYANVHTGTNPGGEIRGQIFPAN